MIDNNKKNIENKIVVIEGPSGAGKDTIIKGLINRYPDKFAKLVSVATREMRPYESQGNPYIFVNEKEFDTMLKTGDIFEHTTRHGCKRGMSEKYINKVLQENKIPLKDCDMEGVRALKSRFENVKTIFIMAEKNEIEKRLRNRGDSEEDIKVRLKDYDRHIKEAKNYEFVIENKEVNETIDKIIEIIYS